jgi:hypothetical protein
MMRQLCASAASNRWTSADARGLPWNRTAVWAAPRHPRPVDRRGGGGQGRRPRGRELFGLVTRAWPYRRLTREEFEEVVDLVSFGIETGRGRRMACPSKRTAR